jgi:hypothetical protein
VTLVSLRLELTYSDLGLDLAFVFAEHDEVGNLSRVSLVFRHKIFVLTFSASDQAAPLAPVLLGVFCSMSDILVDMLLMYTVTVLVVCAGIMN